jgi:hypothetical protein
MSEPVDTQLLLVRIDTKLDLALRQQEDHEGRIRSLERWRYTLPTSAVLSVASIITAVLTALFR